MSDEERLNSLKKSIKTDLLYLLEFMDASNENMALSKNQIKYFQGSLLNEFGQLLEILDKKIAQQTNPLCYNKCA